jgi:hypothetical protein
MKIKILPLLLLLALTSGCFHNHQAATQSENKPKFYKVVLYNANGAVIQEWSHVNYFHGSTTGSYSYFGTKEGNVVLISGTFIVTEE